MEDYYMEGLGFTYEGSPSPVICDITATIPRGKVTLLLGESGSGKTTLIEVLMHIAPEYRPGHVLGSFSVEGIDWSALSLKEMGKHIGLVFQNPESQFCTYTVIDELAFGMENLCLSPSEMEKKITEVSVLLGIEHLLDRPLHELSGGEKQRVAIASVLVTDPDLLIFDEPTSNLDPASVREVFDLIDLLKQKAHKTILIVEHQLELLVGKVDHLLVLKKDGSLAFSGTMELGLRFLMEDTQCNIHLPPGIDM